MSDKKRPKPQLREYHLRAPKDLLDWFEAHAQETYPHLERSMHIPIIQALMEFKKKRIKEGA